MTKRTSKQTNNKSLTQSQVGLTYGFRSGLEEQVAEQLVLSRIEFTFEEEKFFFIEPARVARYTPDFILPNGIVIETKGRFVTADRKKHLMLKSQHPDLDIRFVFNRANTKISKKSSTTYAMWCLRHGFSYAQGYIPEDWLEEPYQEWRWQAIRDATKKPAL